LPPCSPLFGRLRETLGITDILGELLQERGFEFSVERAIFTATLHRLLAWGCDGDCESWMQGYDSPGSEGLSPHHLYRAMAWLGGYVAEKPLEGLAPR
jgi:hypothetical protein